MTPNKDTARGPRAGFHKISVIVPANPFIAGGLEKVRLCLAALDVVKLMDWWPGKPHFPHRNPDKVRAIQRSLDWKRIAQIAAYLLQREIVGAPDSIEKYFSEIYGATAGEPGREWPPQVPKVIGFQRSAYPTFSNVLLHVNGATLDETSAGLGNGVANLEFNEEDAKFDFSVIDGQHRINGAYFAVCILREQVPDAKWDIPAEIFIDLDQSGKPPRNQAQIFIDVNFYQKKVDRSLVADLFPTARGREPLDDKERAQDLGRKLMLETGPLVGMVQIPGIKFGVSGVVTLATLNSAIEDTLEDLTAAGLQSLEGQADFLAQCLQAWLDATGRKEDVDESDSLDPENVAYQGRAIVSFLTLIPACIWEIQKKQLPLVSERTNAALEKWLRSTITQDDLAFLDPPYSGVHYSRFYHVLESIARGVCDKVSGVGRYPDPSERPKSDFSIQSKSKTAFDKLISTLAGNHVRTIVTYPAEKTSNGLSGQIVQEIAEKYFDVTKTVVNGRFSTLGGNLTNRKARIPAYEVILVLSPRN